MKLSEELTWRGFVNQMTFTDIKDIDKQIWTFYHGYDCSADSFTVGNLAGIMFDKVLIRHGHTAFILAGGATSLIGDPGGKDSERPLQGEKIIARNVSGVEKQMRKILTGYDFTMLNNLDWTKNTNVLDFMRDVGKHFGMTTLLQRDYIARRLGEGGSGISYTEFSYTLLQAMDFLHLYDKYGITLQVGSSDQWSNCVGGADLIRRARNATAHVLTHPLVIDKKTGRKFGKSEAGAIWLDPEKTSPTQFYQFWVNTDDAGVEDFLKIYTELDKPAIDKIMTKHREDPKERSAQRRLAQEVTLIVHGNANLLIAETVTDVLTGKTPAAILPKPVLDAIGKEIPVIKTKPTADLTDVLVKSGLASSKSEARRLLNNKAVTINGKKASGDKLKAEDFQNGRLLVRKGKAFKDSALVEL
ncbi:MAG TPA: tyrosine--tRNA ligase [Candidatus Saccharimonadales bacterium]|nr:tyrosine--tRNA ligase [Candidatus Saccharimonadales bacterium]